MKIKKQRECVYLYLEFVCTWNSSLVLSKEAGKVNLSLSDVMCTCHMYLLFI